MLSALRLPAAAGAYAMDHPYLSPGTIAAIRERMRQAGVREEELEERFVLGSGAGGQKINKTSSTVMLRHAPSGEVVKVQASRSRELNRWLARRTLAERLLARVAGVRSAQQQEAERIRRQKRRRSRRQRAHMLADKRHHADKKSSRGRVEAGDWNWINPSYWGADCRGRQSVERPVRTAPRPPGVCEIACILGGRRVVAAAFPGLLTC